jgi:DNA (cytosine-5)-methyltransferase 1
MRLTDRCSGRRPTVLDLFSGAGGTALGFRTAGFEIAGAVEMSPDAALTYERNLGVSVRQLDIRLVQPARYREELGLRAGDLGVLIACPPCQGFSRMRNADGAQDERNDLVLACLSYVEEFAPRFALFENVPGLARCEHGRRFYDALYDGLRQLGYGVNRKEIDAADYGTPQHRERIIVIGGRNGEVPPFPWPTHASPNSATVSSGFRRPWITVREAIGRYPPPSCPDTEDSDGPFRNHAAAMTGEGVLQFIRAVPKDGGSRTDVAEEHWLPCHLSHTGHKDVYGRLAWDRPASTVTTGCTNPSKGRFVHPEQDRGLSMREAAALQGFPDTFVFYGKKIPMQIGNAVPVPLARALADALMERFRPRLAPVDERIVAHCGSLRWNGASPLPCG